MLHQYTLFDQHLMDRQVVCKIGTTDADIKTEADKSVQIMGALYLFHSNLDKFYTCLGMRG